MWVTTLETVISDEAYVILICGLFGSLVALLTASKGSFGFTKIVTKICNSERKTLLTTFILGILIFVDDYLNVLSIGTAMKGSYDKKKVPRESLAYILDSTGSPVCVLIPFSSWAAYFGAIFLQQESIQQLAGGSLIKTYMMAIPYCIYPIVALLIVFLFCMGWFPKLGGMKKAYARVAETGKTYSDISRKYNVASEYGEEEGRSVWFFIIPLAVLVGIAVVTGDLVVAAIIAILVCMVLYIAGKVMTFSEFWDTFVKGFADMLPIIILLIAALTFQNIASEMQMTEFFVELCQPIMSGKLFPMIAFIIVGLLAFMIANAWGVCTLVAPVLIPLGVSVGANPVLIMAAILSGCAFGNHACFYCDTTVLASNGAGIDNLEHAASQLPYVIIGAAVSIVGFLILGIVM
jgi:Na+/H+ antiporter NhaC